MTKEVSERNVNTFMMANFECPPLFSLSLSLSRASTPSKCSNQMQFSAANNSVNVKSKGLFVELRVFPSLQMASTNTANRKQSGFSNISSLKEFRWFELRLN